MTSSHWDSNLPWWTLKIFERLSSILEIKSWGFWSRQLACVQFSWVPSRGLTCSFVKLNYFSSTFLNETSSNVSEKIVVRKSLAPKAEARKAGSANNDADQTPRPPISAGRASCFLELSSEFTLHSLESLSRTVLSYFSKWAGWLKHVLVLRKYNNFGRLKQFFNIKTIVCI